MNRNRSRDKSTFISIAGCGGPTSTRPRLAGGGGGGGGGTD